MLIALVVLLTSLIGSGLDATPTTIFPKLSFTGVTVSELLPLPVMETVCVPPGALSVKVRDPLRVPNTVGRKDTRILQDLEGASEPGHPLTAAKSPVVATFEMSKGAEPVLVTVTDLAALAPPTGVAVNVNELGVTVMF